MAYATVQSPGMGERGAAPLCQRTSESSNRSMLEEGTRLSKMAEVEAGTAKKKENNTHTHN